MPRIRDTWTGIAVYIYDSLDAAQGGDHFGGSGFVVTRPLGERADELAAYVITNKHVIKDPAHPWSTTRVIRLNRSDGTTECIPTTEDQWICHEQGDDVAVFPLDTVWEALKFATIDTSDFVTPQLLVDEDIGIGDDTVMVGRFINYEGKQRNTPSVRFGNIAMMNGDPIHSRTLGIDQESFLVETRSLPGYSGSAVLIYSPCAMNDMSERRFGIAKGPEVPNKPEEDPLNRHVIRLATSSKGPFLLGIDWCHIHRPAPVRVANGDPIQGGWYVEENTGMAGVIPAWKIAEVLEYDELVAARKKQLQEFEQRNRRPEASLDSAERPATQFTPEGAEIPIPTQEQFLDDLTKATKRVKTDE
ncbi:MAG: trypsin-like peptidase domain-containing protein [Candidatus Korobacteraceae bacterium]